MGSTSELKGKAADNNIVKTIIYLRVRLYVFL